MPFLDAKSVLVMEVLKDVKDPVFALLSNKLQGTLISVQYPAQDLLPLTPSSFSFQQHLFRYGLFLLQCHCIWLHEDFVHCMHDTLAGISAAAPRALCDPDKVINKNVHMCDRSLVSHEQSMVLRLWQQPWEH